MILLLMHYFSLRNLVYDLFLNNSTLKILLLILKKTNSMQYIIYKNIFKFILNYIYIYISKKNFLGKNVNLIEWIFIKINIYINRK